MAAVLSTSFARSVNDWDVVWTLARVTGVQVGHLCAAESELATVTKVGPGTSLTVRRGVEGTAVARHAVSTPVAVYLPGAVWTDPTDTVAPVSPAAASPRQATATLTDAQIKALPSTPVVVVPAPGMNRVLLAPVTQGSMQIVLYLDWYGDYTNIDATATWECAVGPFGPYARYGAGNKLASFLGWGAGGQANAVWLLSKNDSTVDGAALNNLSDVQNQPITLGMVNAALGNLTGGHAANTLTVSVLYSVLDVTTGRFV